MLTRITRQVSRMFDLNESKSIFLEKVPENTVKKWLVFNCRVFYNKSYRN